MKLRYKIVNSFVAVLVVALGALAIWLAHDSASVSPPPLPAGASVMKAMLRRNYGPPDVLTLEEVAKPTPAQHEILIKVHAASINPYDWHFMRGTPYLLRLVAGVGKPRDPRLGADFAGTVEAVGPQVTRFHPGDEVFGGGDGALAEYLTMPEDGSLVAKPANMTFEQAAAVPIAALTALQGLRDKGQLKAGQKVLINGASGGVGTFAVQIAKSFGAEVTGVCSTSNTAMVRAIGADHVVDYTREDFTQSAERYDLILDTVGNRSLLDVRRLLKPNGVFVIVGGKPGNWIGPLMGPIKALLLSPFVSQKFVVFIADMNKADLAVMSGLMQSGKVKSVIDKTYPLSDLPAAMRYVETGHARGKVVVDVN